MQLVPIVPTSSIEQVAEIQIHLCLSYRCLQDKNYLGSYSELAKYRYVILDNSVHELRSPDSIPRMLQLAAILRPAELVIPDSIGDSTNTVHYAEEMIPRLKDLGIKSHCVPQGLYYEDWKWCCSKLCELGADVIGLTRYPWHAGKDRAVLAKDVDREVHFLGCERDLNTVFLMPNEARHMIRSLDTAKPAVYAIHGIELAPVWETDLPHFPGRPSDFFDLTCDPDLLRHNIAVYQAALDGGLT